MRAAFAARLARIGPCLVREAAGAGERLVTSLFWPIGSEPDVGPLAAALDAAGASLVLPVDWSPGSPLVYRRWAPGDRLAIGPMGIAEPLALAPAMQPDVLFVPLAAFDRRGHRLGYGAGNVDRTLTILRGSKRVRAIGIAFAAQEEPSLPIEPHDEPLDTIVTEREIVVCERAPGAVRAT